MNQTTALDLAALAVTVVLFVIMAWLRKKKHLSFAVMVISGTVLGIIMGLIFKQHYTYSVLFGVVYTNVLTAFVIPLLLFSIVASITNLADSVHLQKIGLKSVLFLLLNTFTAATITLIAANALNIGHGFVYTAAESFKAKEIPTIADTVVSLFPNNLAANWSAGQVVPVILFSVIVALAYNRLTLGEHNETVKPFKAFIDAGNKVMGQAVSWIIRFTPYAVLSLIARAVGRSSVRELLPLLGVLLLAYALCAVQLFGVESLLLRLIGRLSPVPFFKGIAPAAIVAFTSQSSVGTVPVNVRQLEKLGVNSNVAAFTAGLGANLGMPGCAGIWPVLLAVFTVHSLGLSWSPAQYLFLIVLSLLVSLGTVGVPGTATVVATALFAAAGLPIEYVVIFAPISSIVDMARTATNVVGAATAAVLTARTEGLLDVAEYNAYGTEHTPKADTPSVQTK